MNEQIIAHKVELRKARALKLVESGAVSPNGADGQFYVRSQAGNGRYLAALPSAFPPLGKCNCPDFRDFARHHGFQCKHIMAVQIHLRAEEYAHILAATHNLTLGQLENQILSDLCAGIPEPMATKVVIILHAVQRLRLAEAMEEER